MKRLSMLLLAMTLVFGGVACSQDQQDEAGEVAEDAGEAAREAADDAAEAGRDAADRAEDVANDRTVNIDNFAYEPEEREITRGTEVTWVNQDDAPHTVTADSNDAFESDELEEGDEFSHRFTEEGTYKYHCEVHGADRMSGTITVKS